MMDLRTSYLNLIKMSLADLLHRDIWVTDGSGSRTTLGSRTDREVGLDWPAFAETMIGLRRLNNIEACFKRVLADGVLGDLIEAGVWRGGATIFMRAVLHAYEISDRKVFVADSFSGFPPGKPEDGDDPHHRVNYPFLRVPLEEVVDAFRRYNLLDDQVVFIRGFFEETLHKLDRKWAILRIDADSYSSTMTVLKTCYAHLSPGGYTIIDDYADAFGARRATDDFRRLAGIQNPIERIDAVGAFWRKT